MVLNGERVPWTSEKIEKKLTPLEVVKKMSEECVMITLQEYENFQGLATLVGFSLPTIWNSDNFEINLGDKIKSIQWIELNGDNINILYSSWEWEYLFSYNMKTKKSRKFSYAIPIKFILPDKRNKNQKHLGEILNNKEIYKYLIEPNVKLLEREFIDKNFAIWERNFRRYQKAISILGYFRNLIWDVRFNLINDRDLSNIFNKAVKKNKAIESILSSYDFIIEKIKTPELFKDNYELTLEDLAKIQKVMSDFLKARLEVWFTEWEYFRKYVKLLNLERKIVSYFNSRLDIIYGETSLEAANEKINELFRYLELILDSKTIFRIRRLYRIRINVWYTNMELFEWEKDNLFTILLNKRELSSEEKKEIENIFIRLDRYCNAFKELWFYYDYDKLTAKVNQFKTELDCKIAKL